MHRLSFRYLLGELISPVLISLLVFGSILLVAVLYRTSDILSAVNVRPALVGDLLLFMLPYLLTLTIPMALLMGMLLAYGRLSEQNEILALKAGGVSYAGLFRPALFLGVLFGLFMLYCHNVLYPLSHQLQKETLREMVRESTLFGLRESTFYTRFPGYMIYVKRIDPETGTLQGVLISRMVGNRLETAVVAPEASLEVDPAMESLSLNLPEGRVYTISGEKHSVGGFEEGSVRIDIRSGVDRMTKGMDRMMAYTTKGLLAEAERLRAEARSGPEKSGRDFEKHARRLILEFHNRLALPAVCLVLPWVAVPLALRAHTSRKSIAFGLSLVLIFGYYLLVAFGKVLVKNRSIPPWAGAWLPILLLLAAGIILTARAARR